MLKKWKEEGCGKWYDTIYQDKDEWGSIRSYLLRRIREEKYRQNKHNIYGLEWSRQRVVQLLQQEVDIVEYKLQRQNKTK